MLLRPPTLVGVFAIAALCIGDAQAVDCDSYAQQGYCEQPKYQAYMQKHCPEFCGAGAAAQADGANEDEENCQSWADDGYCTHEQYREYMEQSCRNACGFGPVSGDGQANDEAAVYYNEGEASEESLDGEDSVVAGNDASTAETRASGASSMAEESEHCAGWARQGLCEAGSAHYDYMKANCAFTCDDYAKGGGSGAYKYDPIACARWAMSGLCEDGNSHVAFMKQNCPSECEAALNFDPDAGKPPPADFWLILIVGGFGALAYHVLKQTVASDAETNSTVASKTLGRSVASQEVGPGKPNRSAMGMHVRSAKRAKKMS